MTQGSDRSHISRREAHGHVNREPKFLKALRMFLRPLNLLQPAPGEEPWPPKGQAQPPRDPLEETPEEALRRLQSEKLSAAPTIPDESKKERHV